MTIVHKTFDRRQSCSPLMQKNYHLLHRSRNVEGGYVSRVMICNKSNMVKVEMILIKLHLFHQSSMMIDDATASNVKQIDNQDCGPRKTILCIENGLDQFI